MHRDTQATRPASATTFPQYVLDIVHGSRLSGNFPGTAFRVNFRESCVTIPVFGNFVAQDDGQPRLAGAAARGAATGAVRCSGWRGAAGGSATTTAGVAQAAGAESDNRQIRRKRAPASLRVT